MGLGLFDRVGRTVGKYPLRASGGVAAVGGGAATYDALGSGATASEALAFLLAHPAYPLALVAGLLVLLFVEG
ncbi:hypothetical protein [Halorarius halobius]|uniref:hypothetical protein n=1 Tax=Halorarius halobius TaxID=2962671 RepID=UPI0020CE8874|nr:hypothetical protein [Halorarius halobius]